MTDISKKDVENILSVANSTVRLEDDVSIKSLQTSGFHFSVETEHSEKENEFEDSNYPLNPLIDDSTEISESDEGLFAKIAKKMVKITEDSGVKKLIKREGTGAAVFQNAEITVHYSAYFEDQFEPFDSTYLRKSPLKAIVGSCSLIEGFDIAVLSMKKGEISQFIIQPDYAYGKLGCPPRILPNAEIFYEIEILSVSKNAEENFGTIKDLPLSKVKEIMTTLREEGNDFFKEDRIKEASDKFNNIIKMVESETIKEDEDFVEILCKTYCNLSLCYMKLGYFGKAISNSKKVLVRRPDHLKALYLLGKCFRCTNRLVEGKEVLMRAHDLSPNSEDISKEIHLLVEQEIKTAHDEKAMCKKMFS